MYNEVPNIPEVNKIQGYNEAPIEDVQMMVGNNRKIARTQYFALTIVSTAGAGGDVTPRDIVFTGANGDVKKSYTQLFYNGLGAGNELTAQFTKSYTIDTFYENNESAAGTNTGGIIKVPIGSIVEIQARFNTATQLVRLNNLAGDYYFLNGSSLIFTSTNTTATIMSNGTQDLQLRMQYYTSAAERPNFGIFIKIYD